MKPTNEILELVKLYALLFDYDIVRFKKEYKGYLAYYVSSKEEEGAFVGYPSYVLINSKKICRMATHKEVLDLMA